MIQFTNMKPAGYLPSFFDARDPRPAAEQFHESYAQGGGLGLVPFKGFEVLKVGETYVLRYPGDPDCSEISRATLRDELIVLFSYSWLLFVRADGSYVVARAD